MIAYNFFIKAEQEKRRKLEEERKKRAHEDQLKRLREAESRKQMGGKAGYGSSAQAGNLWYFVQYLIIFLLWVTMLPLPLCPPPPGPDGY